MRSSDSAIAEEIVGVLPVGSVARLASVDRDSIRFAVQSATLKLRSIVLNRASLRRLLTDAQRAVKVEYLQRDLLRSAVRRAEFRYPILTFRRLEAGSADEMVVECHHGRRAG